MNCPLCQKELPPPLKDGKIERYFCDCIGFSRPVIEISRDANSRPDLLRRKEISNDRTN